MFVKKKNIFLMIIFIIIGVMVPPGYHCKDITIIAETKEGKTEKKKSKDEKTLGEKADDVYDNVKEKGANAAEQAGNTINNVMDAGANYTDQKIFDFWEWFYSIHDTIKVFTPGIFVGSEVLGFLLIIFARKDKSLRKWGIVALCIVVPAIILFIVYGMPYIKPLGTHMVSSAFHTEDKSKALTSEWAEQESTEQAQKIFNDVKKRSQASEIKIATKKNRVFHFWDGFEAVISALKSFTPQLFAGSELLGILFIMLSSRDKSTQKWAGISLCGVLPALLLIVVYGLPVLREIFS